jgi:hypothetical protein
MQKIPCLFQRDQSQGRDTLVRDEVTPGCEWVLEGEGIATRKWDGTCCLIRDGKLYKRYEVKRGKARSIRTLASNKAGALLATGRRTSGSDRRLRVSRGLTIRQSMAPTN